MPNTCVTQSRTAAPGRVCFVLRDVHTVLIEFGYYAEDPHGCGAARYSSRHTWAAALANYIVEHAGNWLITTNAGVHVQGRFGALRYVLELLSTSPTLVEALRVAFALGAHSSELYAQIEDAHPTKMLPLRGLAL